MEEEEEKKKEEGGEAVACFSQLLLLGSQHQLLHFPEFCKLYCFSAFWLRSSVGFLQASR